MPSTDRINHFSRRTTASVRDDGRVTINGGKIRRLRKQRCLSRERLADLSGLTVKTLRNMETNGSYRSQPETVYALAAYFGVDASTLITADKERGIHILSSSNELINANVSIVSSARKVLACIGSRSRDPEYLQFIEKKLKDTPTLLHYRVMALPPFKKSFQEHLLTLLKIRNPFCRAQGHKITHIGIYDCLLKQPEVSLVANENRALVVLPSMFGVGEYNTALLVEDPYIAQGYIRFAKSLYNMGRPLETEEDILELGLSPKGEYHV